MKSKIYHLRAGFQIITWHIIGFSVISSLLWGCVPTVTPTQAAIPELIETSVSVIPATGTSTGPVAIPVIHSETFVPSVTNVLGTCTCTATNTQAINIPQNPSPSALSVPLPQASGQIPAKPVFDIFVDGVKNGNARQIVGVYMEDLFRLRVVQQPPNQPAFISPVMGVATQFLLAFEVAGNIGLLAHNYLSGQHFFFLIPGNVTQIINGDGNVRDYEVTGIYQFQALTPTSPTSDFLDLATNQRMTASELFNRMYMGEHHLTFQTCITQGSESSWGRLFVIAYPF